MSVRSDILIVIVKLPIFIFKLVYKSVAFVLKKIFGFVFGWIGDVHSKMSGEDFEKYVLEILKRTGYKHVKLTKRSGDYGIDILADYKGKHYGIQCKLYQKPVGVAAIQQACAGSQYYQCDEAVVVTNQHFTRQAIALAQSNDVLLWDKEMLDKMRKQANRRSLFHRCSKEDIYQRQPYERIVHLLQQEGYASSALLARQLSLSEEKAYYILEDLCYYDLVSKEDHLGIRDLYFSSYDEAMEMLKDVL